jgi:two-component system nitrate/nitrite response regulator NarL
MNIKVIIADDHQLFIDGIRSILSSEFDISIIAEATNGLELIKLLETGEHPDIILTDIRMPIMDGINATKIITKTYPNIPVLALTMFDQSADVYEMMEAGARGYVTKEVNQSELVLAIHTMVSGKKYFSSKLPVDFEAWYKTNNKEEQVALTKREKEILALLARGRTTLQMAQELQLSKFTIDTHRKNIHKKLGTKSNVALINYALNMS